MSQSSGAKGSSFQGNSLGKSVTSSSPKRSIVISVAKDKYPKSKAEPVESPKVGFSNRHIETALGTIAPKAVRTLPPLPEYPDSAGHDNNDAYRSKLQSGANSDPTAFNSMDVPSSISVKEVQRIGLPGLSMGEEAMIIRRRKPVHMQQLIRDQILRKPGININDSDDDTVFSALEYYGCREEPLDELLLTTFQLIVRIPVQAAADIVVDMPEWMRKTFLTRFKLPPLINEVLSSRIDGYEQPEDDAIAVAAEVVWSNALAAGSMAESAVTFFPPDLIGMSSLNRLKMEGTHRKLRPRRDFELPTPVQMALPTLNVGGASESDREIFEKTSGTAVELEIDCFTGLQSDREFNEQHFENLSCSVWGGLNGSESSPIKLVSNDESLNSPSFSAERSPLVSDRIGIPAMHTRDVLDDIGLLAVDTSGLVTEELLSNAKRYLNAPRCDFHLSVSDDTGSIRVSRDESLTLPPAPKAESVGDRPAIFRQQEPIQTKLEKTDKSVVKLDNGNLVLL